MLMMVAPELWFVRLVLQRGLPQGGLVVGKQLHFVHYFLYPFYVVTSSLRNPLRLPPFFRT